MAESGKSSPTPYWASWFPGQSQPPPPRPAQPPLPLGEIAKRPRRDRRLAIYNPNNRPGEIIDIAHRAKACDKSTSEKTKVMRGSNWESSRF